MPKRPRCSITVHDKNLGFTLIEILLVVLIIGILTTVGVNITSSQSIERSILSSAQQFESDLKYMCEKAVFENQTFGFEWTQDGYHVLNYQSNLWQQIEHEIHKPIPAFIKAELLLGGTTQNLESDIENRPHIICQSDGSFNAFELRMSDASLNKNIDSDDLVYYSLISESPWQLKGGWHQQ